MYLLKLPDEPDELLSSVFTFHYVSIKTRTPAAQQHRHNKFTFHYVSIKTHSPALISFSCLYLHSTMYLLKRLPSRHFLYMLYHLHSTMYLLKRSTDDYIKQPEENLHSTMYLLKQISESKIKTTIVTFTFHYVSIKTH